MREYLLHLREENRFTQKEVAQKLGISESYYNRIEKGDRQKPLKIDLLDKMCKVFKISIKKIADLELDFLNSHKKLQFKG